MNLQNIIDKFNISSEREDYAVIHDTVERESILSVLTCGF